MKIKLITLAFTALTVNAVQAQGLLGKLKDAAKPKESAKVDMTPILLPDMPGDYKDEFGYSGRYYTTDTAWHLNAYSELKKDEKGRKQYYATQTWKFVREESGQIVNKLYRYNGEITTSFDRGNIPSLDEKLQEKANLTVFSLNQYNKLYYIVMLEKDVFGLAKVDYYKNTVLEYMHTYAKDKTKLDIYDKETGAAKMQQLMNDAKAKEFEKKREKWMKNATYAKMIGKIGFMDDYHKVAYNQGDITEKPEVFMSSVELGKQSIFYRAYYKTPGAALCSGCELNTTYEIDGIKVSRIEQRKKSSKWSNNIKQKFVSEDFFSAAPTIVSFQENIADYAFLYCLYQNKEKLKEGKSLKMKVTLTTNQDGIDKDVLAEGTITLNFKEVNRDGVDKMIKWIDDLLAE